MYPHTKIFTETFLATDETGKYTDVCHGNFGPPKILVRGIKNSWKIGPPDHYFLKILVRAWNYGPSENTLV